jgi:hypothetical protein
MWEGWHSLPAVSDVAIVHRVVPVKTGTSVSPAGPVTEIATFAGTTRWTHRVTPANAGVQFADLTARHATRNWIPAFAGMTPW